MNFYQHHFATTIWWPYLKGGRTGSKTLSATGESSMMQILTLEEAKVWVENHLYEVDSYLFPLNVAVKNGLLVPIDGKRFAVKKVVTELCTWVVDSITRLTDEEMAEHDLSCRYRYNAHAENCAEDYQGVKRLSCGIL